MIEERSQLRRCWEGCFKCFMPFRYFLFELAGVSIFFQAKASEIQLS